MNEEAYRAALAKDARKHKMRNRFGGVRSGFIKPKLSRDELAERIIETLGDGDDTAFGLTRSLERGQMIVRNLLAEMVKDGRLGVTVTERGQQTRTRYSVVK